MSRSMVMAGWHSSVSVQTAIGSHPQSDARLLPHQVASEQDNGVQASRRWASPPYSQS